MNFTSINYIVDCIPDTRLEEGSRKTFVVLRAAWYNMSLKFSGIMTLKYSPATSFWGTSRVIKKYIYIPN